MKLFDATLDLARFAKGTEDYTISAVTGNQITCNELAGRAAEFGGGTIWIRTGDGAGQFGRIKSSMGQTIITDDTFTGLAAGDQITIGAWLEFDTQKLINAINAVLSTYKIVLFNSELEYTPEAEIYELPEGVTHDIRRVIICPEWNHMDRIVICHFWKLVDNNYIQFYGHKKYPEGTPVGIYYVDVHGPVYKDTESIEYNINPQVDPLYLRYMAWLYLCRNLIQNTHKDNLVSSDMYNEAKIYERDYGTRPNKTLGMRDFTFPSW